MYANSSEVIFAFAFASEPNKCHPNPCQNGGACTELLFDFECTCPHGYHGKRCEGTENDISTKQIFHLNRDKSYTLVSNELLKAKLPP